MIDIHTHILPGVDDGARNLSDSIAMAELAVSSGVHTLVATPHSNMGGRFENYNSKEFRSRFEQLQKVIHGEGIPLLVLPGMEIFTTGYVMKRIQGNELISLNHSRYYLMEFPFLSSCEDMNQELENVIAGGCIPVIAHPERYESIQENPRRIVSWRNKGMLIQVNRGSILGKFGHKVKSCVDELLDDELVTCIASDAHKPYERTTFMGDIQEYMEKEYTFDYAKKLLYDNPKKIIENQNMIK
ncbi:MAG: hypothetical protein PHW47_12440 [Lachnospira sp.]|nr:hypothetical protein [Lachnospira sp.]